jgi:predicted permease
VRDQFRASLPLMFATVACLWLITTLNVAGLLTARLRQRSREMGLRLALGVTSRRLIQQLLIEAVVIVLVALLSGVAVALGVARLLPTWIPSWAGLDVRISAFGLAVTGLAALLTVVAIASIQAFSVDRRQLLGHIKVQPVPLSRGRRLSLSTGLIVAQIAITLPLVVAAALLGQTTYRLFNVDSGFDPKGLLQVQVEPVLVGHSPERSQRYYADVLDRLRSVPGVSDASVSSGGALSGFDGRASVRDDGGDQEVRLNAIDERYFGTLGIRTLAGRAFQAEEVRDNRPVIVLNLTLARRLFGAEQAAIGRTVTLIAGRASSERLVVGVVGDTADVDLRDRSTPVAFIPVSPLLVIHVRTKADAVSLIPVVRQTLVSVDPGVPVLAIQTIEGRRWEVLRRERLLGGLAAAAGWLALALCAVGLFGRVSYDVSTRVREVGIRSALGASRARLVALFLADTAGILVAGFVLGTALALGASRFLEASLYGVSTTNVATYILSGCVLTAVALLATVLPLRPALSRTVAANLARG